MSLPNATLKTTSFQPTNSVSNGSSSVSSNESQFIEEHFVDLSDISVKYITDRAALLGRGGYADVFPAEAKFPSTTNSEFIVKVPRTHSLCKSAAERLKREAAVGYFLSQFPNFCKTFGGRIAKGDNFILMERASSTLSKTALDAGKKLQSHSSTFLSSSRLDYYSTMAKNLLSVATALKTMHAHNLIHCDVKPDNILLQQVNGTEVALLSDFGSTVLVQDAKKFSNVKAIGGTHYFLSPESLAVPRGVIESISVLGSNSTLSLLGAKNMKPVISAATDVWAFGVTMLTLLNFGINPFVTKFPDGESFLLGMAPSCYSTQQASTSGYHLGFEAFSVCVKSNCPKDFYDVVKKCLIVDPRQRASMNQVIDGLKNIISDLSRQISTKTAEDDTMCLSTFHECSMFVSPDRSNMQQYEVDPIRLNEMVRQMVSEQLAAERHHENNAIQLQNVLNAMVRQAENEGGSGADQETNLDDAMGFFAREQIARRANNKPQTLFDNNDDSTVYQGPRGGLFRIKNGSRVYLPPNSSTKLSVSTSKTGFLHNSDSDDSSERSTSNHISTGRTYASSGTANGREIFQGARGGEYTLSDNGNKSYLSPQRATRESSSSSYSSSSPSYFSSSSATHAPSSSSNHVSTGQTYVSSGSANGREIFQGARGGQYTLSDNGNKSYLSPQRATRESSSSSYSFSSPSYFSSSSATPAPSSSSYSSSSPSYFSSSSATPAPSSSSNHVSTGQTYVSSGSANGREIFQGARGGQYYLTSKGNKSYL